MKILFLLAAHSLLGPVSIAAQPVRWASATVEIRRSFITWSQPRGEIRYETVCKKTISVPVYDFREHPELRAEAVPAQLTCDSFYQTERVPILLRGLLELVRARVFGLGLPPDTELKRTYFDLSVAVGEDFPFLHEVQSLAPWQLLTADLNLRSELFLLSPEALVMIRCTASGCAAAGPQSVYRADVNLNDGP